MQRKIKIILIGIGILTYLYILIFSSNGLIERKKLEKKIKNISTEINILEKEINEAKEINSKLKSDTFFIEKLAREKYKMRKTDEKIIKIN
ncbi:MAG TPA: septum formation initiator family protein [bacterium]|nr:septum formation initiator family protein [bacterium]HOL48080.1 septum formation initiator family protein [bacterium]HPQ19160.1 septum formation initiator family protein [bacterium]